MINYSLDLDSLRASYAEGADPGAVLHAIYAEIAKIGERPVWITLVPQDQALARAADLRRRRAGGEALPLYGIPFAVKDNIDVAGLETTAACPAFAYKPKRSATVVERLEAAGAILIGKTNLDQFATGLVGVRSPYGIPSCVFDPAYVSGGSSSGSAVAVASGLVSFALGTDTAGSGRVPAAFNNIVGLKPTKGWLSIRGVVPACRSQDCVSVFAGTVEDAFRVAEIAGGYDAEEPFSRTMPEADAPASAFRFGVPKAPLEFFGDNQAASLYADAVARLEGLGGTKVAIDYTPFRETADLLYSGPWVAERLAAIEDFAKARPDEIHPVVREIVLGGAKLSAVDAFKGQYRLADLARAAEAQWKSMDVMLLPTTGTIYKIDEVLADPVRLNSNLGAYTNFVNLLDLSAVSVPAGFRANGLPFGVTLIGKAFEDRMLADIAGRMHSALKGATIGSTGRPVPTRVAPSADISREPAIAIAVVGAHLSGQPLNRQLTDRGARLVRATRTATGYSLYALPGTSPERPGMIFDRTGHGNIEIEIWEIPSSMFGSFIAEIPPPLSIGTVTLEDGSKIKGFLCESFALAGARDITTYGGWRAYREAAN